MKNNEIVTYSELANRILYSSKDYSSAKGIINKLFSIDNGDNKEAVKMRLAVIDSLYSTNMNKRYYGIDDIATKIINYYPKDEILINDLIDFTHDSCNNDLLILFNSCYGISKTSHAKGSAKSLISKYGYFITNGKFPIFDTIVFESYPMIVNFFSINNIDTKLSKDISKFVTTMAHFNQISEINDFSKLDNLLWLVGKILRGNLSLILSKETYQALIGRSNIYNADQNFDLKMKQLLFENFEHISDLLSEELYTMVRLTKEIKTRRQTLAGLEL